MPGDPVADLTGDPEFWSSEATPDHQLELLRRADPNIGEGSPLEQRKLLGRLKLQYMKNQGIYRPSKPTAEEQKEIDKREPSQTRQFFGTLGSDIKAMPRGFVEMAKNPKEAAKGALKAQTGEFTKAKELAGQGRYVEAGGHALAGALPILGPPAAEAGEEIGSGEYGKGLARATELIAPEVAKPLIMRGMSGPRSAIARGLRRSAEEEYAKVLAPSPKADKFLTEEKLLNPQGKNLLDRRVAGLTSRSLRNKLVRNRTIAGRAVGAAFNNLPPTAQTNIMPILHDLYDRMINEASEEVGPGQTPTQGLGNRRIIDQQKWDAYQNSQLDIIEKLGAQSGYVTPKSLRKLRQSYENLVSDLYKGGETKSVQRIVTKNTADAIRDALNSQHTTIEAVNAEYTFWRNAADVMSNTVLRKVGQQGALNYLAKAAGAALGFEKGGAEGALIGGYAASKFDELFRSTAWRTVSAVTKNEIAKALASGKTDLALRIATRATVAAGQAAIPRQPTKEEQRKRIWIGSFQ